MDNFFKGLGDVIGLLSKAVEVAEKDGNITKEFRTGGEGEKPEIFYGFNMRTNLRSIPPSVKSNSPRSSRSYRVSSKPASSVSSGDFQTEEDHEPLIDIFNEDDEIVIIAELSAISEQEISVEIQEDIFRLQTTGERRYVKEILLPAHIDEQSMRQTYRNDILEVRLKKASQSSSGGGEGA